MTADNFCLNLEIPVLYYPFIDDIISDAYDTMKDHILLHFEISPSPCRIFLVFLLGESIREALKLVLSSGDIGSFDL